MKTIWKFQLIVDDEQLLEMPKNARILNVQVQHDIPCIWALVDPQEEREFIHISTRGTGHPANGLENMEYLGSYQLHSGNFVGHLFRDAEQCVHQTNGGAVVDEQENRPVCECGHAIQWHLQFDEILPDVKFAKHCGISSCKCEQYRPRNGW